MRCLEFFRQVVRRISGFGVEIPVQPLEAATDLFAADNLLDSIDSRGVALGGDTRGLLTVHPLDLTEPDVGGAHQMSRRPAGLTTRDRSIVEDGDTLLLEREQVGSRQPGDARPDDADVHVQIGCQRPVDARLRRRHPHRGGLAVVGLHVLAP